MVALRRGGVAPIRAEHDMVVRCCRCPQSFETELDADPRVLGEERRPCRAMFIRAPAIVEVLDPAVDVLASLPDEDGKKGVVVAVQQGHLLVTSFHVRGCPLQLLVFALSPFAPSTRVRPTRPPRTSHSDPSGLECAYFHWHARTGMRCSRARTHILGCSPNSRPTFGGMNSSSRW